MFKKSLLLLALVASVMFGSELSFNSGFISTHTEIFGDKTIDNNTSTINAMVSYDGKIEDIKGEISLDVTTLKSKKPDRDEHLYKALESEKFSKISFKFTEIKLLEDKSYEIVGLLTLHGVEREVTSKAAISQNDGLKISGAFSLIMSEYGVKPPSLLFLTVRDQVDIAYDLNFK